MINNHQFEGSVEGVEEDKGVGSACKEEVQFGCLVSSYIAIWINTMA